MAERVMPAGGLAAGRVIGGAGGTGRGLEEQAERPNAAAIAASRCRVVIIISLSLDWTVKSNLQMSTATVAAEEHGDRLVDHHPGLGQGVDVRADGHDP